MNKESLCKKLDSIFNGKAPISLEMYIIIIDGEVLNIKRADIDDKVTAALKDQFAIYANLKFIENDELALINLSDADNRKNVAYVYDYQKIPEGLSILNEITLGSKFVKYDFTKDDFKKISGFVFLIGNENEYFSIYKKHYPVNLLKRDSVLRIIQAKERLVKLDENILSINETFELLKVDDKIIVISIKLLERFFGFEDIIRGAAEDSIKLIENSDVVEDINVLRLLSSEIRYAKKIVRINKNSPVLKLPKKTIINFIINHPVLQKKLKLNDKGDKLALDTKVSQELFVKLLNDDFLKSELTELYYDSQAKDFMVIEEEGNAPQ